MRKLFVIFIAVFTLAFAESAHAIITKQEAFDKLRGRVGDDDIHRYGIEKGLAGLLPIPQGRPYYRRYGDSEVWIYLSFVTWQNTVHNTCGVAFEGSPNGDVIMNGPWTYDCGGVTGWQYF